MKIFHNSNILSYLQVLLIIVIKKITCLAESHLYSGLVPKMLPQQVVVSVLLHWANSPLVQVRS